MSGPAIAAKKWPEGSLGAESALLRRRLAGAGIENAASDADLLLCWALGCDRSRLTAHPEEALPADAAAKLAGAARRREAREPMAYILGEREFWSLPFTVRSCGLIPRPETELLVERAAAILRDVPAPRVLDICTGSGAVGVALAVELPGATVLAVDLSEPALSLAAENARRNGVEERFETLRSDLFGNIPEDEVFDAVISNPPYIASGEIDGLMPEVARFEPREALDGGPEGMVYLRRIIRDAPARLKAGGALLLEMDPAQVSLCIEAMRGAYRGPAVRRDLAGRDRVIEAVRV